MPSAAQNPRELTTLRILHETAEHLDQDADWHIAQHAKPARCERHPAGAPVCWHTATATELRELGKAVMLAPNLYVCEAFLRGETVPLDRMDAVWVRKLGRR